MPTGELGAVRFRNDSAGGDQTRLRHVAIVSGFVIILFLTQLFGVSPLTRNAEAAGPIELRIGFLEKLDHLSPFIGLNDPSFEFYGMIYDYLFSFDQDGNFIPNLALSATADAYGANWTYQIRQGVKWHDGTPFTADDVAFTINYNTKNYSELWNYKPYMNQVRTCPDSLGRPCGAVITSPWNVTVYFNEPFVAGKALFVPIVQKAQWENIPLNDTQSLEVNCPPYPGATLPIGTGPFIADPDLCTQFKNHWPIALHKNPNYHPVGSHTGPAKIDNIYMIQFLDESQMVYALQTGVIDLAKFTSSGYDSLAGKANVARAEGLICTQFWTEIGISQLDMPTLNPARYDENVRRAMAKATNKDYIIQTIYGGKGARGTSLMSPITPQWWYDPTTDGANLTFNIAEANALLDAAGYTATWTDGTGTYRMASRDITFNDTNGNLRTVPMGQHLEFTMDVRKEFLPEQETGRYLAAEWARIGIKLDVTAKFESQLSDDVYNGGVDTYIWFWSGDPDPNYLLSIESGFTLDGWNDNYWNNATYNQLYVDQLAAFDPVQRQSLVRAAQKLNYESATYIVYIYDFGQWGWRTDRLSGWGDWNAHPYRQMDNFWGANPLFLDLAAIGAPSNNPPTKPVIQASPPITVLVNESISFVATSMDPDPGDTLVWTWNWGDVNLTLNTHASSVSGDKAAHAWGEAGEYNLTLEVTDGKVAVTSDPIDVFVVNTTGPVGWINGTMKDQATGSVISGGFAQTTPAGFYGSGQAGTYSIRAPVGTYSVQASDELHRSQSIAGVAVADNRTTWVNFTLAAFRGWVAGGVTSTVDAGPINGSAIYLTNVTSGRQYALSTNAQGSYNWTLPPGTYSAAVSAAGFHPANQSGILVVDGRTTRVDFALAPLLPPNTGLSPLAIAGIAVAVLGVVIAVSAVVLIRRRRKTEQEARIDLPKKEP
jgi:peptide/nickel transport system substrate-binding protein